MEQVFGLFAAEVNIPAEIAYECRREGGVEKHTFSLTWKGEDAAAAEAPELILRWKKPIVDIQYTWHPGCGANRTLRPDWHCHVTSQIASGCPITCFYNDAGRNRCTLALSDCLTAITRRFGAREEDACLACSVNIPLDTTGKTEAYRVTLWIDETDRRYEEAIGAVVAWWETMYPPMPVPEYARLPMYSCWYSFHQQVYAAEVEAECERAAALGMKTVIVDDGWQTDDNQRGYAYCGDWQNAPAKIPDMRAHVEKVHASGLKYMLWYGVPLVGKHSEAARRFEGKMLDYMDGLKAYVLDPRYPEVRAYLIGIYEKALRDWNLDGFKLDFIDRFQMVPGVSPAFREGMDYVALADGVHRLMVDVMNALRAIKPDILIEFRQSYIGPVMREFGNMLRVGDCPVTTLTNRVGMVDLRLTSGRTAVHSDMLVWNEADRVENAVCQIENVLFAVVQISVRLDRVPESHVKAIRFWTQFMEREQALLLDAPLTAECPQMLYPVVRAGQDGRAIVACYERDHAVALDTQNLRDVYVVNASSASRLILDCEGERAYTLTVMNCTGDVVREEAFTAANGLVSLSVPECGLIRLRAAD